MTHTPQKPIGSGFGPASSADEVIRCIDLTGKTVVVTGGASGIGIETVRAFRSAGARVIVPARDTAKAKTALSTMPDVIVEAMDLLEPKAIDRFASRVLSLTDKLDILVNNAGVMAVPLIRDARGYEMQFAANHLGHFQLTCRLCGPHSCARRELAS
ncbi:SDR family NAD(P)-dependent oxidoreductase [Burkholderia cepacia]|uniref:SDR family NAD(P)-dependent oxidoreductase n=1 Tax=Burkholderia cepacia TaxID=292 RepID=UPI002AB66DE8|nr:SDR family NAD(P)-dependent oxidoreductase [Burkholderia cepacia]